MKPHYGNRLHSAILAIGMAALSGPTWAMDTPVAIPEPGTMALLLGGVGAAVIVWRKNRK